MSITTVISDIMGVLLLKDPDWQEDVRWEKRLGLPQGSLSATLFGTAADQAAILGHISQSELLEIACQTLGLAPDALNGYEEALWAGRVFNLELARFLRCLRPRYKIAIWSNAWSEARRDFRRLFQLHTFVDHQIFSTEVRFAKPDERFYWRALARLGAQPEEVVFLDDRLENVEAARRLGMQAILFEKNEQAIDAVRCVLRR